MCALAVVLMVGGVLFGGVLSAVVVFAVEVVVVTSPLRIRGTRPFHPGFLSKLSASLVSLITVGIHFVVSIN